MSDDDDDDHDDDAPDFDPKSWQPTSLVEQALAPRGLPVQNSEDLTRVLNLQRRPVVVEGSTTAEALINIAQGKFALPPRATCECRTIDPQRKTCVTRLLWAQAWMLYEIEAINGLLSSCPVGGGKTIVGLLAPLALQNVKLCLLLIPPTLVDQIIVDFRLLKQHFYVPNLSVHQGKKTRNIPAEHKILPNGREVPTLHVLPYSRLSSIESSTWIENLRPDAIICDEVDALKSMESARTLRVLRYFATHWQSTRFLGWTGSLTDSSVTEFGHLSALALREGSPMPLARETIEEWGRCLDAVPSPAPPGALIRLLNPGEPIGLNAVRRAFQRRIAETPGFVVIGGRQTIIKESDNTEVELDVCERAAPAIPDIIAEALDLVRHNQRPDKLGGSLENEIIVDPMEQARCAREVASGVFNRIVFPHGEPKDLIIEWLAARKNYFSELRVKMLRGEAHLDSPKLCERAAMRAWGDAPRNAELPEWRAENWPRWRDVMNLVRPASEPVYLHPYLVDDAIVWAQENVGIVWYLNVAWGRWMAERTRLVGLPLPLHEGGPGAGDRLRKEVGRTSIIASLNSHGRGRNGLQFVFHKQLFGQVPSSATRFEQCLDESTEILTNKGWVGIDGGWGPDHKAAAYNIDNQTVRWEPAMRMERRLGQERVYGIKNHHLDIRVTAGHRMICKPTTHSSRHTVEYLPERFVTADAMPRISRIPVAGNQEGAGVTLTDDELRFIGLFMSDGNYNSSNQTISIFQSERYPEVIEFIKKVLAGCRFMFSTSVNRRPSNFGPRSPLHCWTISQGLRPKPGLRGWVALTPYIDKDLSPLLDDMTRDQLGCLLEGLFAGDGDKTPGTYMYDRYMKSTINIATARRIVADRLQSICVRRGMRCNVSTTIPQVGKPIYKLRISPEQSDWHLPRSASDSRPVWSEVPGDPNERVWCVSVASGAIITRRNGKVAIVGNCLGRLHRRGQEADRVESELYLHTPELQASFEQAIRRAEYVESVMGAEQKLLSASRV